MLGLLEQNVVDGALGEAMVIPGKVGACCDREIQYGVVWKVVGPVLLALSPSEMVLGLGLEVAPEIVLEMVLE